MADLPGGSSRRQEQEQTAVKGHKRQMQELFFLPTASCSCLLVWLFTEDYPIPMCRAHKEQQR